MTAAECPNCRCRDMRGGGVYEPALTEPTKIGYVGILASFYGTKHHVYRYTDNYNYYNHAYRLVGLAGGNEARGLSWGVVLQAGTFTAATS